MTYMLFIHFRNTWMSWEDLWFWQTSRPNKSSGLMYTLMLWYDIFVSCSELYNFMLCVYSTREYGSFYLYFNM